MVKLKKNKSLLRSESLKVEIVGEKAHLYLAHMCKINGGEGAMQFDGTGIKSTPPQA